VGSTGVDPFAPFTDRVPRDPSDLEAFVDDLVAQLTDAELCRVMSGDGPLIRGTREMSQRYNGEPIVAGRLDRLGIPGIRFTDGPRGVVVGHSTAFPSSTARAATFDTSLEERIGDAIGVEGRIQGANLFAGVCINLLRHPAWGRAQETYGEDPFLLGEFGAALVRGTTRHLIACVKHFALNSIENSRFWVDVRATPEDLRDLYLPHFRRCLDAGADSVMSAYNQLNGEPCGHNASLLEGTLRREWGSDAFVMSDFTWGIRNGRRAVLGGMDLEMPFRWRFRSLPRLLRRRAVSRERLRASARRLLLAQARGALRGEPERYRPEVVAGPEHRALAREAATRSLVLLRNEPVADDPVLPLDPTRVRRLGVIGELATTENLGDHGSSQVHPTEVVTLLQGLTAAAARHGVELAYLDGTDRPRARALAAGCDAVVVAAGSTWRDEGEWILNAGGDRSTLRLTTDTEELICTVADANPATVVVLNGGSAFDVDPWLDCVAAVIMAWYPGMEGGHAVADVLFGDAPPGGRVTCTWPAADTTLPTFRRFTRRIDYGPLFGYRMMEATGQRARFPFGFGLGYATFEWSAPRVVSTVEATGDDAWNTSRVVTLSVDVTNTSSVDGVEVVQAYVPLTLGSHRRPLLTLRGFTSAEVPPGATVAIEVVVHLSDGVGRIHLGRSADPEDHVVVRLEE